MLNGIKCVAKHFYANRKGNVICYVAHDVNALDIADLTDVANVFDTIQRANILQYTF